MDYTRQVNSAKKNIDKYGVDMLLEITTNGAYNGTLDSFAATVATYDIKAVISNPTVQNDEGEYGKSDRVRLLVSPDGLPASLSELDFRIVYGSTIWKPAKIVPLKPGGTAILFTIDMK